METKKPEIENLSERLCKIKMEQSVKSAFMSEIGNQCDELYSTSDGRIFIRHEEALLHTDGKLDEGTKPLSDKEIKIWFRDFFN